MSDTPVVPASRKTLVRVAVDGLKQLRRFDLEVPPLLAVRGPNGAGKSALFSALKIGVLGHDPDVGRRPQDTRLLVRGGERGGEAIVAMAWNDGFALERTVGRRTELRVMPPRGERLLAEAQARIDQETGGFVLSFSLAEFLARSRNERARWLLAELPRSAVELERDDWRRWLGYEEAEDFIRRAIDHLWEERVLGDQSLLDGLASAIEATRERYNSAEAARLAEVKIAQRAEAEAEAAVARAPLGHDPAGRAALEEALATEQAIVAAVDAELRQHDDATAARRQLLSVLATAEARVQARTDVVAAMRASLETARARLAQQPAERWPDEAAALREAEAAAAALPGDVMDEAERAHERAARRLSAQSSEAVPYARERLATARAEHQAAEAALAAAVTRAESFGPPGAPCPTCGESGAVGEARARAIADADAAETVAAVRREAAEEAERGLAVAEAERSRLAAELAEAASRLSQARRARDRVAAARGVLDNRLAEDEAREKELAAHVAAAEEALAEAEQAAAEARAAVAAAPERDMDVSALHGRSGRAAHAAEAARAALGAWHEADRQYTAIGAAVAAAGRAAQALDRATARRNALQALLGAQQRLRNHVIEQLVRPVEQRANEMLQAIDPAKTFRFVFEREGRIELDFGFEEAGEFRSWDAASTGERAFLGIVFVAALTAVCRPPWAVVLLDNAESVDDLADRRTALMGALAKIQQETGAWGNVILAGCCDFPDVPGWAVVDMRDTGQAPPPQERRPLLAVPAVKPPGGDDGG